MTGLVLAGASLLTGLFAAGSSPAACAGEDLLAIHGKWVMRPYERMRNGVPQADVQQVAQRVERIARLFRAAYPEPRGTEAVGYWDFRGSGRPYPYAFNSLYKPWYCNTNLGKLLVGEETFNWAHAFVNHLNWFAALQKDFQVDGRAVYLLTPRSGELKGRPAYAGIGNRTSNTGQTFSRAVLITRPGRSPLQPVTRQAFLQSFLATAEARQQKNLASLQQSSLDPARRAEALRKMQTSFERELAPARETLRTLSTQEGAEPAILGPLGTAGFKEFASEPRGQALVFLDNSYFDRRLPPAAPQFLVVYWSWENNPPSHGFRAEFERNVDLDALAALLDR